MGGGQTCFLTRAPSDLVTPLSGNPLARPPLDGTQLVVLAGLGWLRHTCISKGFLYCRDHFISTILSLLVSYLALSYVLP